MTEFGRRAGIGDMLKAVYDPIITALGVLSADHKTQHQNTGSDEIDVGGLSGELADDQEAKAHGLGGLRHVATNLAGLNAKITNANMDDAGATRTPAAHKISHQDEGTDEVNAMGLVGVPVAPLLLDAVAGRVLRQIYFKIHNGTNGACLRCEIVSQWNGDSDGPTDVIVHGTQTGNYDLSANGQILIAVAAAFTGNVIAAWGNIITNASAVHLHGSISVSGGGIAIILNEQGTGLSQTLTALVDVGNVELTIAYITDA